MIGWGFVFSDIIPVPGFCKLKLAFMALCDKILVSANTLSPEGLQREHQAIVIADGLIVWCGLEQELPGDYARQVDRMEHCNNQLVTPGLIDCHTHLVYAGDRADEFRRHLQGMSYVDIARGGGGILSTVRQTRAASLEELVQQSLPRLNALRAGGVTTVEIKSGYGLDLENEVKILQVARLLGERSGVRVRTTFLGAHALPPEYRHDRKAYVDYLCRDMLPAIVDLQLADALDVFCESIAFSPAECEKIFQKAQDLGLPIKCHAEQLSNTGASELAASFGALSCDHLEFLDRKGALSMAKHGTVAVLLPGAFFFPGGKKRPPVSLLRELGVPMAIATDCNPGTSPTASLGLMMSMACHFFAMTIEEVWAGVTSRAAQALGIEKKTGAITPGLAADLLRWEVRDSAAVCYYFGYPLVPATMIAGQWVTGDEELYK